MIPAKGLTLYLVSLNSFMINVSEVSVLKITIHVEEALSEVDDSDYS